MRALGSIESVFSGPRWVAPLLAAALLVGAAPPAAASLIGDDEVTLELDVTVIELGSLVLSQTRVMGPVGPGLEDSFLFTPLFMGSPFEFDILIEVDLSAAGLIVRAANQTGGGRGAIDVTARFRGLDPVLPGGVPGIVESFGVDSDFDQVVSSAVIDGGHGIQVRLFDEGFQRTDDLLSIVDFSFVPVPEPAPLLLAAQVVALAAVRRRSSRRG